MGHESFQQIGRWMSSCLSSVFWKYRVHISYVFSLLFLRLPSFHLSCGKENKTAHHHLHLTQTNIKYKDRRQNENELFCKCILIHSEQEKEKGKSLPRI